MSSGLQLKPPFGNHLVRLGKLSPAQWTEVREQAGGDQLESLRLLLSQGHLGEEELLGLLAAYSEVPLLDLEQWPDLAQPPAGLSYEFLKSAKVVPVGGDEAGLDLAVADPFRPGAWLAVGQALGVTVRPWLAGEEWVLRRVESAYGLGGRGLDDLQAQGLAGLEGLSAGELGGLDGLGDLASEAPVIRLLNFLVDRAVAQGASDIHLEPQERHCRVRFRVDGHLTDAQRLDGRFLAPLVSRVKIMARLNIAERRTPQDGQINLRVGGRNLDLRVATLPTAQGEGVVLRLLYRDALDWDLTSLGVEPGQLERLLGLIERPHGLILVTGPTGSGKTTTLYCALKRINRPDLKTITIEDPVEYRLPGANQIQINPTAGLTFASGLRSILRQDPDVILVGEIRDRETAGIAIHAALTGHLVFSTLHTNDAPGAITRLQDMGVDSFLISSALTAVLAQRLVRRLCPQCRQPVTVDAALLARHEISDKPGSHQAWRGVGCPACGGQGYRGRSGIFELMEISDALRELINVQAHSDALRRKALSEGMVSLRSHGWLKVKQGQTSLEEVLRVTAV